MKNKLWLYSAVMLYALAISAFSPIAFAQAGIIAGQSDVMPIPILPAMTASLVPAEPGVPYRTIEDANSQATAAEKRTPSGDNFSKGLFERPFTSQDMAYLPETDLLTASVSSDEEYYYFTIQLAGVSTVEKKLTATYGIEIDIDKDGRGDYLVTSIQPGKDWSSSNVRAFFDKNQDVGGSTPIRADPSSKHTSDGYEVALNRAGAAFVRLDPANDAILQLSVKKQLIGDATQFLWSVWADNGLRNLRELDYNDRFSSADAGSPIKSDKTYPVKALSAVDNTCRVPYGFTTKAILPGMCLVAATTPEKPSIPRIPGTNPIT